MPAERQWGARAAGRARGISWPPEPEHWSPEAVFLANRCDAREIWQDGASHPFHAGVCPLRPALATPTVEPLTPTYARQPCSFASGRRVEVERHGVTFEIAAETVVVTWDAVNSAALLPRSSSDTHPNGLANGFGLVGRAHELDNLSVVDASSFPSAAAVNPALTIAAQALRVAHHLAGRRAAAGRAATGSAPTA